MSIEALPNELLVKIFSLISWDTLRELSRVNRRWYQVIGHFSSLRLTKSIHKLDYAADVCIPLEVLTGSSREYCQFSCDMESKDPQINDGDLGTVLKYCNQRWNINGLRLVTCYKKFILFLQNYKHLLNDVVTANVSVYDDQECATCDFVIPMGKLKRLNLIYKAASYCSLSLHAPNLELLSVDRGARLHLTFTACPKLRSVWIRGNFHRNSCDPVELESILPQAQKISRLEITHLKIANIPSTMFEKLQTIILTSVTINSMDNATLECLNLKELQLRDIKVDKPLKLRVPQMHTLNCDIIALQSWHLHDAFQADLLVVDFTADTIACIERIPLPEVLPSFHRLHLLIPYSPLYARGGINLENLIECIVAYQNDINNSWIWPCLSGITELTLQAKSKARFFHRLENMWKHFQKIYSVCLVRMEIPGNFDFLPVTVQNVFIEDCSITGSSIAFPPNVGCVRITKLWTLKTDANSAEMVLLPPNRYRPIESQIVREDGVFRRVYSTKDCREPRALDYELDMRRKADFTHPTIVT